MDESTLIEGADDSVAVLMFMLVAMSMIALKRAWDNRWVDRL